MMARLYVQCGASCNREAVEVQAVAERPQGALLWAQIQPGDVVIAPKLDRLFRSALDALQTVEALKAKGVHLHLLNLGGDIAGNGLSKLFLTIAAAFAEAERDRIRERVSQVNDSRFRTFQPQAIML